MKGEEMNKDFNMGSRQKEANKRNRSYASKRLEGRYSEDEMYCPPMREFCFAYKGVVIRKAPQGYTVDKQIKISGCIQERIDRVEGSLWNDGPMLQQQIDYMLETAKPERLAEVRAFYFNWTCSRCKATCLYDKHYERGHEYDFPEMNCKYCGFHTPVKDIKPSSDEVFR
ncbi:hypothetical protein DH20_06750 [Pantoea agglomerans]|nr:hypothetical protein [Pantoea agglomerans]